MSRQKPEEITFIDPLSDFGFKRIFVEEPNKDLLIAFLNEVFKGKKQIVDLVYSKNEHPGDTLTEGGAIFDLLCTGEKGEQFIIEVQRSKQENFKKRAIFYTSRLISEQAPRGKRAEWSYDIREVYLVALLDSFSLDGTPELEYLHDICLCYRNSGKVFYQELGYIFLELIKFVKTEEDLETDLDRWLYVLKNMSRMKKVPVYLRKPVFEKVFQIASYSSLTKEEKRMYDISLKRKWDNQNALNYARKEGIKEGIKKGMEEGAYKRAIETAIAMKKDGLPLSEISKYTRLSEEEIKKL